MDSTVSSGNVKSISSAQNRKRKADDEGEESMPVIPSKRTRFYQTYCRQQPFTLPDSLIYYITKNPATPKIYAKLVQRCKFFFIKNPVLILSDLTLGYSGEWKTTYHDGENDIDLDNITSKLWITDELIVTGVELDLYSILPKIFQCDVKILKIHDQDLFYDELIALGSKAEKVYLRDNIVEYEDGSIVPFEKVFKAFPKIKRIQFSGTAPIFLSSKTFRRLMKLPTFLALDRFQLSNIPEAFDLERFYAYMKQNKITTFELCFSDKLSDAYKARIDAIVDEIVNTPNREYKPAFLSFPGYSGLNYSRLERIVPHYDF